MIYLSSRKNTRGCLKIVLIILGQLFCLHGNTQFSIRVAGGAVVDKLTPVSIQDGAPLELTTAYDYSPPVPVFSLMPSFRINERLSSSIEVNFAKFKREFYHYPDGGFNPLTHVHYNVWQISCGIGYHLNSFVNFDLRVGVASIEPYRQQRLYGGNSDASAPSVNNAIIRVGNGYTYRKWTIEAAVSLPLKTYAGERGISKRFSFDLMIGRRFEFRSGRNSKKMRN